MASRPTTRKAAARAASAISEHFASTAKPAADSVQTTAVPCLDEAAIQAGLAALLGQRDGCVTVAAHADGLLEKHMGWNQGDDERLGLDALLLLPAP